MKKIIFIFLIFITNLSLYAQNPISFAEALKNKLIQVNCVGNDKSVHYLKPLIITIKNLQNSVSKIILESGMYFSSSPENFQDITTLEELIVNLQPQELKTMEVFGVCCEATYAAPNGKVSYSLTSAPKNEYVSYAKFIEKEKLYGTSEAQYGMWALSNDHDWRAIYASTDENGGIARKIRNEIAKIKGVELKLTPEGEMILGEKSYQVVKDGKVYTKYTHIITETQPAPYCEMSGGASYSLHKNTKVRIGMFDDKNVLVREIYFQESEKPGMHHIKYAYDCDKYTDNVYHFKIIKNDYVSYIVTLRKR